MDELEEFERRSNEILEQYERRRAEINAEYDAGLEEIRKKYATGLNGPAFLCGFVLGAWTMFFGLWVAARFIRG